MTFSFTIPATVPLWLFCAVYGVAAAGMGLSLFLIQEPKNGAERALFLACALLFPLYIAALFGYMLWDAYATFVRGRR